jgi:hypothetical protein
MMAVYPHDAASFDPCKLPLLLSQCIRAGKIHLNHVALPDRHGHGHTDKNPYSTNVGASPMKEPAGLRQPNADGPRQVRSLFFALFYRCFHTGLSLTTNRSDDMRIGTVKIATLAIFADLAWRYVRRLFPFTS